MRGYFATSLLSLIPATLADTVYLAPELHNGSVTIETLSVAGNLDGFKMNTSANASSYDYWWFDVVSEEDDTALNIVFYNAGDIGNPQPIAVEISGVFSNGTRFLNQVLSPDGATVSNGPRGVRGSWLDGRATFRGTNLEKKNVKYEVKFRSPELGVFGDIQLKSRAPAHYPCDPNVPGVTQLHLERFFWSNAVPDADAFVNLNINGTKLKFNGIGYHDKNWGDKTVLKSPKFWDWGHTRLGPYSLVWYDLLDYSDNEYHRSYIAKGNKILRVSCDDKSVITRPWGGNATWPPALGLNAVDGVVSRFDLGDGQTFVVNVTKKAITYDRLVYTRAVGLAKGGIEGSEETYEGKSFFDEFTYGLVF
ncbi:hypothetical protein FOQG_14847 [Fusarium oxysporum f. sp. raphani 54005]|uniref:Hydroxyneurosporene synthase (CrtC) n=2 Tax=Fusarium oxysporum f. sp. raphani TaxID=96318 RepID=X0BFQ7_FUSOX|nr:hypothetical protein FOQG_14847 [Fusarium oxysporum f. sp. raphani 54005]KAG7438431.1 Tyrosinase family protein asqI [Fusarium oxysporum f. sp. raphani]